MVYYHEMECPAEEKKMVRFPQGQGLINPNMTVSTISSELLVRLQPD